MTTTSRPDPSTTTTEIEVVPSTTEIEPDPRFPMVDWRSLGYTQAGWGSQGLISLEHGCTTLSQPNGEVFVLTWPLDSVSLVGNELTYLDHAHNTTTVLDITLNVLIGVGEALEEWVLNDLDESCPEARFLIVFSADSQ